jgi:hypothetical protein
MMSRVALYAVWENCTREQRALFLNDQSGCLACAMNLGVSRKCFVSRNRCGRPGWMSRFMQMKSASTVQGSAEHAEGRKNTAYTHLIGAAWWTDFVQSEAFRDDGADGARPRQAPAFPTQYCFRPIPDAGH